MHSPTTARADLFVAGRDLAWLSTLLTRTIDVFDVTIVHAERPLAAMASLRGGTRGCAIVEIDRAASAIEVRDLLNRLPGVAFCFVAGELPLRHAVARVIRHAGHAVVGRDEPPFVIAATAAALLAARETPP